MALKTNLFKATTCPISLCTSFTLLGEVMSNMALTFSGLAFMPRCETMKLRNLLDEPQIHTSLSSTSSDTSLMYQKFL